MAPLTREMKKATGYLSEILFRLKLSSDLFLRGLSPIRPRVDKKLSYKLDWILRFAQNDGGMFTEFRGVATYFPRRLQSDFAKIENRKGFANQLLLKGVYSMEHDDKMNELTIAKVTAEVEKLVEELSLIHI